MKYESQKVAYWFFATCMLLLSLQLVYGFIMAFAHAGFDVLHPWIPFNVARASHNNLLVMWMLSGFMGAAYFIIPDECERPIYWPRLAYVQLIAFVVVGVTAIVGFHFGWWEGRKFLEIPRPLDYLVVVDVLLFVINIGMTVWKAPKMTTTSIVLFFGLLMAAVLYLPGMIPTDHQTHDAFWRWWVVHLWVEGVWELIMGGILAYLLIRLTGVDREIVEKWLYVIVGFTFLSGILGTGHHYYFIGTPSYWLWIGGIFSALEPLAFLGMAIYGLALARKGGRNHPNRIALFWTVGCCIMSFVGAGLLGARAHAAAGEPVHPRHAGDGDARSYGVLGRLRDVGPRHHDVRPATLDRTQALRHAQRDLRFLVDQHRHGRHDGCVRCRRRGAGLPRAPRWHGVPRRAA